MHRIILLLLTLLTASCGKSPAPDTKPSVLVSIPPYAYFVKKIAGDAVETFSLVPAGANPHIYEPTPREAERHQNAALWIRLGEPSDKKFLQYFEEKEKVPLIVTVTEGIELLSEKSCCHHHESKDFHAWLSPHLAKEQAVKIAAGLIAILPEKQGLFEENLLSLLHELDLLDKEIASLMSPLEGKTILVSHPAFGYFCRDYHLTQLSVEMEGKDPLPQDVATLVSKMQNLTIQSILTEPQYSNKGAELIASHLHLTTHMVDPYAENYPESLRQIAQAIRE
ncbi:MAG: zinc ABC transporter substrate-binding protein [Verrucomicrobia bacterium]|nr:zinc ABC transporter substrate-binding protein [Verrucomicrobiota bacterium]